jgi:peptide/nickel transport system permease protein
MSDNSTRRSWPLVATLARQIGGAIITLAAISIITFAATNLKSPTEIARSALGRYVTDEQLQAYVEERGLDKPPHERYASWLGDLARGDLGVSAVTNRPVVDDLLPRLKNTAILAGLSLIVAIPIAFLLGAYIALHPGTRRDVAFVVGTVVAASLPEFVLGIGVILVFGVWLGVLPIDSTGLVFGGGIEQAQAYLLPVLALALAIVPQVSRIARATFREAFAAPYMQAAALRGLSRRALVWRNAMPNASVVLVHVVSISVMHVIGGVIVIENVFSFPGIGQLLVEAVRNGDAVMLQACVLLTGTLFIAVSLCADLLASIFNPRLRAA